MVQLLKGCLQFIDLQKKRRSTKEESGETSIHEDRTRLEWPTPLDDWLTVHRSI